MEGMIRRSELEGIRSMLERHSVAAVIGPAGFGKSSLLTALQRDWEGPTVRVPYNRSEAATRLSGLDILLASLSVLDAEVFSTGGDGPTTEISEAEAAETLMGLLREARIPDNTLIIITDADGMDESSQMVLGQIVRRLRAGRVRIVISARSVPSDSPLSGIPSVELRTLGETEMAELAEHLTSGAISREAVSIATQAASGRPHALRLILADMTRSQKLGRIALPIPGRVGRAAEPMVRDLVGERSAEMDSVLRLLAAAPLTPFRSLQRRFPELWEHADELEARGVLERRGPFLFISRGLVRAFVHTDMGSGERIALHESLEQLCTDSEPSLQHWHASFSNPSDDAACRLADDAVGLIAEGFPEAGVEFIERAIRMTADTATLGQRLLDIAEVLFGRGDLVFASRYMRIAATIGDPGLTVCARALKIEIEFAQHQNLPSRLLNSWTRTELEQAPAAVARLQLVLGRCHLERGEYAEAQELLDAALSNREHFGPRERQICDGIRLRLDCYQGDDGLAVKKFVELGDLDFDSAEPAYLLSIASGLTLTEHYESALAVLDLLRNGQGRETIWWTLAAYHQAEIAIRSGNIGQAVDAVESAEARTGTPAIRLDRLLVLRSWSLLMRGLASDAEPTEMQLAAYAAATHNRNLVASLNAVQGSYLLRTGYPADAVRHLLRCDELTGNETNANVHRYEPELIEALVRVGRREHASLLFQQLRRKVARVNSRWAELALSRCEAILTTGDRSVELFRRTLRSWKPQDSQLEKALTHEALARRLIELGSQTTSREHSIAAATLYIEIGAEHLIAAPNREVEDLSPGQASTPALPELFDLTDEELKVVELVRAGLKNRDIARRVFVSLRTVELRLTAVYRKLDVASRTELVARLAGSPRLTAV